MLICTFKCTVIVFLRGYYSGNTYHFSSGVSLKLQGHRGIPWIFEVAALLQWSVLLYSVSLWGVGHVTKCHSDTWVVSRGGERRKTDARLPSLEVPAHTARASGKRGLGGGSGVTFLGAPTISCVIYTVHQNTETDPAEGGGSIFLLYTTSSLKRPLSRHALLKVGGVPQLSCRESPFSTLYNYVFVSLLPPF